MKTEVSRDHAAVISLHGTKMADELLRIVVILEVLKRKEVLPLVAMRIGQRQYVDQLKR